MKHYRIMHIGLVDDFVQKILNFDMVPLVAVKVSAHFLNLLLKLMFRQRRKVVGSLVASDEAHTDVHDATKKPTYHLLGY